MAAGLLKRRARQTSQSIRSQLSHFSTVQLINKSRDQWIKAITITLGRDTDTQYIFVNSTPAINGN